MNEDPNKLYILTAGTVSKILAYERTLGNEKLIVICNFSPDEKILKKISVEGDILISNYNDKNKNGVLRPYEAVVYSSVI